MKVNMNEFTITFEDSTQKTAVRTDAAVAAADYETPENPIVLLQRSRVNLEVAYPDPPVQVVFRTTVSPSAAPIAGCKAAPETFTVPAGTKVIFQALPVSGWDFTGWFLNGDAAPISTNTTETIIISQPQPGAECVVDARFEPSVPNP